MKEIKFLNLTAAEVEARVGQEYDSGITLLLYKDARCDMNILDETVGPMNWQRDHKEMKDTIYAGVGIRNEETGEWVWKWDCGTESRTEAQKGAASGSFKRGCGNVGSGRELETSPRIWIKKEKLEYDNKGKLKTKFDVTYLESTEDKVISCVVIANQKTREVLYTIGKPKDDTPRQGSGKYQPKNT